MEKITVIAHGTHLVPHSDKAMLKDKYKLTGKKVLSTFGLLSSGDWNIFSGKQNSNAELTALSGLSTTGILQRTGAATYATLGTTAPINVTAGNIGLSISASSSC